MDLQALVLTLLFPFFLFACNKTPQSPVAPLKKQSQNVEKPQETDKPSGTEGTQDDDEHAGHDHDEDTNEVHSGPVELPSLVYVGSDPFGTKCTLSISTIEEEHHDHDEHEEGEHQEGEHDEDHEEHEHMIVAKLGYQLHGETPLDSVVNLRRYNLSENAFFPADSNEPGATPALISALLKDESEEVDFNRLLEYEQNGQLIQSLRADFQEMNVSEYEEALDAVLAEPATLEQNRSSLNKLDRAILKLAHNGHYDAVACLNFKLTEVKTVEYDLDAGHDDDHDDDHDHGDHDDHDHGH